MDQEKAPGTIRLAVVRVAETSATIVYASDEKYAYKAIMGEEWPEGGPAETLEWECFFVDLEPGSTLSLERY